MHVTAASYAFHFLLVCGCHFYVSATNGHLCSNKSKTLRQLTRAQRYLNFVRGGGVSGRSN